jgi:glycosyltransferase involved in cell wall biosynthesis
VTKLSVIIPVRDRSGLRAENCLRSLRWQTQAAADVEILVSDFGSRADELAALRALAEPFDAKVLHTPTDDLWNRSRALNVGLRAARGEHVMCTDVDMVFHPKFLATVVARIEMRQDAAMVVCRCRDLPESVPEQRWETADYAALEAKASFRQAMGTGACQAASKRFFERVRGYDERYVYWGFEDKDMVARAERAGLSLEWIHDDTSMLHQWHPRMSEDKLFWKYHNKLRFYLTRHRVKKNPRSWGEG